jgi:hypothetical protein
MRGTGFADHGQRRHQPERADSERSLLARKAGVCSLDPVTQDEAVLGELVGDGKHGCLDALVVGRQETHDGQQQQRGVQIVGLVVLAEDAPAGNALVEYLGLDL